MPPNDTACYVRAAREKGVRPGLMAAPLNPAGGRNPLLEVRPGGWRDCASVHRSDLVPTADLLPQLDLGRLTHTYVHGHIEVLPGSLSRTTQDGDAPTGLIFAEASHIPFRLAGPLDTEL